MSGVLASGVEVRSGLVLDALPEWVECPLSLDAGEEWYIGPEVQEGHEAMPGSVLITPEEVSVALSGIAEAIDNRFPPKKLCIVGLSKGADCIQDELVPMIRARNTAYPLGNLTRRITASSYGLATTTSGKVRKEGDPGNVEGLDVVVLDDLIDTGLTIAGIRNWLLSRGANSVTAVTLLTKVGTLKVEEAALGKDPITGLRIPNKFVVGRGIDWGEEFRELDGIVGLDPTRKLIITGGGAV